MLTLIVRFLDANLWEKMNKNFKYKWLTNIKEENIIRKYKYKKWQTAVKEGSLK